MAYRIRILSLCAFCLVSSVCIGIFSSCDFFSSDNPFPDEYYTANFIASIGFNQFAGAESASSQVIQARWDLAYRYLSWNGYSYITLTPVSQAGYETAGGSQYQEPLPADLPSDAPVYQLELVNLLSGGAMEAGLTGTWTDSGDATHSYDSFSQVTGGGSVRLSSSGGSITYVPVFRTGFSPAQDSVYSIFFRFPPSASAAEFAVYPNAATVYLGSDSIKGSVSGQYSPAVTGESLSLQFTPLEAGTSFGPVFVDDFMLARNEGAILRLRLGRLDTAPQMEGGVYTFSVWVRTDPLASATGSPTSYPLDTLIVTMRPVGTGSLASSSARYTYNADNPGWQRLSASLSGKSLQYTLTKEEPNEAILDLVISLENSLPGSIFLAYPALQFHPDGL